LPISKPYAPTLWGFPIIFRIEVLGLSGVVVDI
jgi:hypothetical protein